MNSVPSGQQTPTEGVDIFLVAGQSNAVGKGDRSESPIVPLGSVFEFEERSKLAHLADPVGGLSADAYEGNSTASTGSPWPRFAQVYARGSDSPLILVQSAIGGSSLHPAAETPGYGTWAGGGSLRSRAATHTANCLSYLRQLELRPKLRGVLWSHGERDAQSIDSGQITRDEYSDCLRTLIGWFAEKFDQPEWFICQTGRPNSGDTDGFRAVRDVQRAVAETEEGVHLATDTAVRFPEMGYMRDELHYSQQGLNVLGEEAATYVLSHRDQS